MNFTEITHVKVLYSSDPNISLKINYLMSLGYQIQPDKIIGEGLIFMHLSASAMDFHWRNDVNYRWIDCVEWDIDAQIKALGDKFTPIFSTKTHNNGWCTMWCCKKEIFEKHLIEINREPTKKFGIEKRKL